MNGTENVAGIQVQVEVTYHGLMLARDDDQRLLAAARHYGELRIRVQQALQRRHGEDVPFALVLGELRGPHADRIKALTARDDERTQLAAGGTR